MSKATELGRTEVIKSGLTLVPTSPRPALGAGNDPTCATFLRVVYTAQADSPGDGECVAKQGQRHSAEWVLFGLIGSTSDAFKLTLQLVPVSDPAKSRMATTFFRSDVELESAVHSAWTHIAY